MPIDLAGRTPYAYTRTSVNSKARRTKNEMERILYLEGDPSTVRQGGCAIRVPASARWGPSLEYLNSCYLSPTPRRQPNGGFGSAISSRTNNAVPFQSPPTTTKHNENIYASADSLLVLLWGAAKMNGKRIPYLHPFCIHIPICISLYNSCCKNAKHRNSHTQGMQVSICCTSL